MDAERLISILEDAGYEARSYSGHGMYGAEYVGVVTSGVGFRLGAELAKSAAYLAEEGDALEALDELAELSVSTDSMGHDMIVYFPGVAWPEGLASDEDEDEDEADAA